MLRPTTAITTSTHCMGNVHTRHRATFLLQQRWPQPQRLPQRLPQPLHLSPRRRISPSLVGGFGFSSLIAAIASSSSSSLSWSRKTTTPTTTSSLAYPHHHYRYDHRFDRDFSTSTEPQPRLSLSKDDEEEIQENDPASLSPPPPPPIQAPPPPQAPPPESQQPPSSSRSRMTSSSLSQVPIGEVVKAKHAYRWVDPVIPHTSTVRQAIVSTIEGGLSGMMVVEHHQEDHDQEDQEDQDPKRSHHHQPSPHNNHVVGLLTSRDLLRIVAAGIAAGESNDAIMNNKVREHMTPISQVIFVRPHESIAVCRTLMAKLGVKCLPVLQQEPDEENTANKNKNRVLSVITVKDINSFGLSAKDKGGKESYLNDVSQRVGLSINTSMADPPSFMKTQLAIEQSPLFVNIGSAMLPHPFKTQPPQPQTNPYPPRPRPPDDDDVEDDDDLSEDAYFCTRVKLPDDDASEEKEHQVIPRTFTYMGVADGVGSWREYGVSPREFSHRLMEECRNVVEETAAEPTASSSSSSSSSSHHRKQNHPKFRRHVMDPAAVMACAYNRVKADNVIGSSTACVGLFDGIRHQLHFSNLGDSGIIVLRHIDSDIAGSLKRDRQKSRVDRRSDLQVTFVSQQQLRSFNHPYQLGWTGQAIPEGEATSFKKASESCSSSIYLRRGDIVLMATDGLYDNVDVDEICEIALEWEQRHGFVRGGDVVFREKRWAMGNSLTVLSADKVGELAQALCQKARDNSLNSDIDSPFAILAKENDIMWSGGMPDDCTVLVMHIVGRDPHDFFNTSNM